MNYIPIKPSQKEIDEIASLPVLQEAWSMDAEKTAATLRKTPIAKFLIDEPDLAVVNELYILAPEFDNSYIPPFKLIRRYDNNKLVLME